VDTIPYPVEDFTEIAKKTGENAGKAVVSVWGAPVTRTGDFQRWHKEKFPVYPTPERAGTALVNLANYSALRKNAETRGKVAPIVFDSGVERIIREAVLKRQAVIQEPEATEMLELAGIRTANTRLAVNADEAVALAAETGYPVVLKVVSEKILHKSDAGGVKLNLQNEDEVRKAFLDIQKEALSRISPRELRGIAVQPMLPEGMEVIVGGVCDEQAGPVVMFGLGGIWVEVFRDTVFRLAPVSPKEAEEMIRSVKGYSILQGIRGKKGIDLEVLTDLIVKMGGLMSQFPLQEIDLNPVIFYESGYAAADVRIILDVKT
jgi:acetate---CoA ligase (ADP-forming) subunit beta